MFSYENQGVYTYLVYSVEPDDVLDTMSLGMLTNNKIPGLASTFFMQMDSTRFVKYNVSSRVTAKEFLSGAVNKKRLLGVFQGIARAMLSAEDYMISSGSILLDLNYIFTDVSTCDTVLVCLPLEQAEQTRDIGAFLKEIMFNTQFDQTENCDYVAKIINYLNSTPRFSLPDFNQLLVGLEKETPQGQAIPAPPVKHKEPAATDVPPVSRTPQQKMMEAAAPNPQADAAGRQAKLHVPQPPQPVKQPMVQPVAQPAAEQKAPASTQQKKVSLFSLMMHYSKENAALYKAQKEETKQAKAEKKGKTEKPAVSPQAPGGFAIPGQPPQTFKPPVQQSATAPASGPASAPAPIPVPTPTPTPTPTPVSTPAAFGAPQVNFGETTVLRKAAAGETTVLSALQQEPNKFAPHLLRVKTKEKIALNKPVFRVGKERSYVDYFVGDNTAVSRGHANFITREQDVFVVDTNSTNHTFVNGEMIPSNTEHKLENGDMVKLANEEFEFHMFG